MKAFKLINTGDADSAFQEGTVSLMERIPATYFYVQTHIDAVELHPHPAPRYQFVVTLKGKVRFSVTNGSMFDIEPGILLIANDRLGSGHSWELIEGDVWERIYMVLPPDADDHFRIAGDAAPII